MSTGTHEASWTVREVCNLFRDAELQNKISKFAIITSSFDKSGISGFLPSTK